MSNEYMQRLWDAGIEIHPLYSKEAQRFTRALAQADEDRGLRELSEGVPEKPHGEFDPQ